MNRSLASLVAATPLVACSPDSHEVTFELQAHSFARSEWSAPVNLGPIINSSATDFQPSLSKDGVSLYFGSNRGGGLGGQDIWVSQRECASCPWKTPLNLAALNTAFLDGGPALSDDGHLLFFHSGRPGGAGSNDIYVSRRANPKDDFGWGSPALLGPDVNTAALENRPFYQQSSEDGAGNLYFNRGPSAATLNDLYYAPVTRDGETRGPAVFIAELNDPSANEASAAIRGDGREIVFSSNRAGSLGNDLWVSTRRSVHDPWSTPTNLGPLNSEFDEQTPSFSTDGRVLLFRSDRPGGLGGPDIWMSTRTPSGK